MIYFGDIYTCIECKKAKGICMLDDIEHAQDEYLELADKYIEKTDVELLHVSRDDHTCRVCLKLKAKE